MLTFTATLEKFKEKGEKTGWTYIFIAVDMAIQLHKESKQSFKVKGKIDECVIQQIALLPMGGGNYILPVNAVLRRKIGKRQGAKVMVAIEKDEAAFAFNQDFMDCLKDDTEAFSFFNTLNKSHQKYFSKWIDDAKTTHTKEKRILMSVNALSKYLGFPEMIRLRKIRNEELMK